MERALAVIGNAKNSAAVREIMDVLPLQEIIEIVKADRDTAMHPSPVRMALTNLSALGCYGAEQMLDFLDDCSSRRYDFDWLPGLPHESKESSPSFCKHCGNGITSSKWCRMRKETV